MRSLEEKLLFHDDQHKIHLHLEQLLSAIFSFFISIILFKFLLNRLILFKQNFAAHSMLMITFELHVLNTN